MINFFKPAQNQIEIDDLFISIKKDRKELKKSSQLLYGLEAIVELLRTTEYHNKLRYYKSQLQIAQKTEFFNFGLSFNYSKEKILKDVIEVLEELLVCDDIYYCNLLDKLEGNLVFNGITPYSELEYIGWVQEHYEEARYYVLQIKNNLKLKSKILASRLSSFVANFNIDKRRKHRRIFGFNFKNMSDESGEENNCVEYNRYDNYFLTLNFSKNGIKFHNRTNRYNFKYK